MEIHEVRRQGIIHQIRHKALPPAQYKYVGGSAGACQDKIAGASCNSSDTRLYVAADGISTIAICGWHRQLRGL